MVKATYNFQPTVHDFTVDGEKLFLQFLLLVLSLAFIYLASRSMRIVEKEYEKTSKKVERLKARMAIVLAQQKPLCQDLLYHKVTRCRQSLVAGYIKDVIDEKQLEPEKCSSFFKEVPAVSTNHTFSCSTKSSENVDSNTIFHTKHVFEKGLSKVNFDELFSPQKNNTNQSNRSREESKVKEHRKREFTVVKSPLESKIFKTLEGPNRRLRSSFLDKKKSKISKWNNMMGCKNAHDRFNENLTVYTALTSTLSPIRVKPFAKSPSQKGRLNLKSSLAKPKQEIFNLSDPTMMEDKQNPKENENQERNFEKETQSVGEVAKITEELSMCSVESSNCDSDTDSGSDASMEQTREPFNDGNVRQTSLLTTINEESAEENSVSE